MARPTKTVNRGRVPTLGGPDVVQPLRWPSVASPRQFGYLAISHATKSCVLESNSLLVPHPFRGFDYVRANPERLAVAGAPTQRTTSRGRWDRRAQETP